MKLGEGILKLLAKLYEPESMVERSYKGVDIAFRTDSEGKPVLLFIGKRQPDGQIKGDRFVRRYATDARGAVLKDHWDHKGKAS